MVQLTFDPTLFSSLHFYSLEFYFYILLFFVVISLFGILYMTDTTRQQKRRANHSHAAGSSGNGGAQSPGEKRPKKDKDKELCQRDKDKELCTEVRRALIKTLKEMTSDLFPQKIGGQRWSWAINHVTNNDGYDWKQLLDLNLELKNELRDSPFFKQIVNLMQDVERGSGK